MVRLGCFTFRIIRYVIADLQPSLFSLQSHHFLSTRTTVSAKQEHNTLKTVNYLINTCGLSPEAANTASKRVKRLTPKTADSNLAKLRKHGFSETQISKVVWSLPQILSCDFKKTLLPKLKFFTSFGISAEEVAKIVTANSYLLGRSLEKQIVPAHQFLKSMLSKKDLITVLKRCSKILLANQSTIVVPNINFLIELGMPKSCIALLLTKCTNDVLIKHEKYSKAALEAKEIGFDMKTTKSLWAIRALCGKGKMDCCRRVYMTKWDWSEDDVVSAFRRYPPCMIVSEKKLMQVMDFLVNKMGWPSQLIAKHPAALLFSLEKRTIPRCSVIKVLMLQGLRDKDLNLSYVLQPPEKKFLEKYVTKYLDRVPQLLDVYQGNVDIQDAKVLVP